MFDKHSIKFKLFIMVTTIIITFLGLFSLFWFYSVHKTGHTITQMTESIFNTSLEHYGQHQRAHAQSHLTEYFSLVTEVIALDCYNLDYEALEEKLKTFLEHEGLCAIHVSDRLDPTLQAHVERTCEGETLFETSMPIVYKGETIATLKITYAFGYLEAALQKASAYLEEQSKRLQRAIDTSFWEQFYTQKAIFILLAMAMLAFVWRQIDRSVVKPITHLLEQMRYVQTEDLSHLKHPKSFEQTEIGQLSQYFHLHIAKLLVQLQLRIHRDPVTGLFSRQKLLEDLARPYALLAVLDLDNFREIKDFFGIDVGDRILQITAERLKMHVGEKEFAFYRINSDEFAMLCFEEERSALFVERLEQLGALFEREAINVEGQTLLFNVSIGLTYAFESPMKAISSALMALRHAKNSKEALVRYSPDLPILKAYERNLRTTRLIKEAIRDNAIEPYFQPIYSMQENRIVKYEALMRIKHNGEIIPPSEFLEVSKTINAYYHLSEQMIIKSLSFLRAKPEAHLSLNLTVQDILRKEFCEWMLSFAKEHDLAHRLIFEITEQEGIENFDLIQAFIASAKAIGASVAIDDFGSGYSNFEHLIHLHVEYLKIDGSLIKQIDTDPNARMVVQTIVTFAHALGIQTVAEYVHSEAILDVVRALGITYAQGYHIAPPRASIEEFS